MTSFLAALSRFIRRLFHVDSYGRSRHPSERHPSERHPSERHLSERPSADRPSQYAANGRVATLETSPPTAALATATAERSVLGSALEAAGAVSDKTPAATADMRRLVYKATYNMPKRRMHAGQFGSRLRKIEPAFTYEKYNFTKLIYLLAAVPDIVSLERVNKQGAAPAYYVRAVLDIKRQLLRVMESFDSEDGWVHVESVIAEMARTVPEFSIDTYGFTNPQPFLISHSDLIESKSENADYIRLRSSSKIAASAISPLDANSSKRIASPKRIVSPAALGPVTERDHRNHLNSGSTKAIVHLSKFAGFTPQILNQKVSDLAAIALSERWYFGPQPPANFAYPILKSYLRYTFIRLQHERKVIVSHNLQYKAFNTGLLDKLLRPIYALLTTAVSPQRLWDLTFCIPGESSAGKALVANFTDLPAAANYLSNPAKVFYHLESGSPEVDWHHIIKDNMERLPPAFLAQYAPTNFTYRNTQTLSSSEFHEYKRAFAAALDDDPIAYRNIVNRLGEALTRTLLKTQINYKTAVPTYYPNINSIDLLLPICLVEEDVADCAIVVRQASSGKYIGHTILTLRQAYNNARLICKLDEHWLTRSMALSQEEFEEEDDDSEEFEAETTLSEANLA
ncbi:MAG: DUF3825 domain-containing protein [Phormidesmis sp.]